MVNHSLIWQATQFYYYVMSFAPSASKKPELNVVVVIVTYKCAALTIESLQSVAAERSTTDFHVRAVVVDNASGDAPQIAAAVQANGWGAWVKLVTAARNGGFAYGNNLGIARAHEDGPPSYIYLLNPDAQVRRGAIQSLTRFMEANRQVGIAGSSFENLDGSDWPIAFHFPSLLSEMLQGMELGALMRWFKRWTVAQTMTKVPQPIDWICGASMLIRPAVLESIGGMDENYFLYFEETDFCNRARKAGFPTWYVPESRVMHIMGQSTSVTDLTKGPKRLPGYWFESRRRYFAVTYGVAHAMRIDLVTLLACSVGLVKRAVLGRRHTATPRFIRDLIHHSVIWPRNRNVPAVRYGSG
jgi:N-acetylglucosaminyl-diphospho-decaprenol L-rhamnosyltransferase